MYRKPLEHIVVLVPLFAHPPILFIEETYRLLLPNGRLPKTQLF
jgi:hypothetical protein